MAFLRAEVGSHTDRGEMFAKAIAQIGADRDLIDRAELDDPQQNDKRGSLLGMVRGYGRDQWLFHRFPVDTVWRLVTVTVAELERFKYANHTAWTQLAGTSRLVADGVKNIDQVQGRAVRDNVVGIANRVRNGVRFPALIAVQCAGTAEMVLMEGHTRATAYTLTGLPDDVEVFIGTSARMASWTFF
ncbi:MAG TPA: hypothetical protein VN325_44140 [Steroidobacteraceae bacterium]|nr:hypothetical protein [Steroidobacteraceae bacterium]